jgi:hypothetical protein
MSAGTKVTRSKTKTNTGDRGEDGGFQSPRMVGSVEYAMGVWMDG